MDLFGLLSLVLLAIIGIAFAVFGGLYYWGELSPGNGEIIFLTMVMSPSLLFICLYGLNASLMQCEGHYFLPSVAPVAFNISWVIGAILLWILAPNQPMYWLACIVILGSILQWLMTVPHSMKIIQNLHPKWEKPAIFSRDLRKFGTPLFLGILGVCATQINNALDAVIARYAQSDGPALLWYAIRLQQLPLALFGVALSGALLPPLSRAIKNNDLLKYRSFLKFAIQLSLLIMIPTSLGIYFFGDYLIDIVYRRGSFTATSTAATFPCLQAYSLGLAPMVLVLILAPAFYAKGLYSHTTAASIFSVILNIALSLFFVFGLKWGAASIALATSISAWANVAILGFALKRVIIKKLEVFSP
jgi:putative peptidoglycan lipid II flippase